MNYREWLEQELPSAPPWRQHVDARHAEALKPRRTASTYSIASYATVDELRSTHEEWTNLPRDQRDFAWSASRVEQRQLANPEADLAPNRPLAHLRRWDAGLKRDELRWIGATSGHELHKLYCSPTGYVPSLPTTLALCPAPSGRQASLAAAKLSGADFGTPEARRQSFRRASPFHNKTFRAILRPEELPDEPA
jgi:hypothetical protein